MGFSFAFILSNAEYDMDSVRQVTERRMLCVLCFIHDSGILFFSSSFKRSQTEQQQAAIFNATMSE